MIRVLVVEDEPDIQDLLVLHLRREGFEVTACSDGPSAWQHIQKGGYSLIVLDWMLPGGMSGIEIARQVRERQAPGQKIPEPVSILMVTARVGDADIVAGLEAGADDYVTKPFETSVFLARVRALIRRNRWMQDREAGSTAAGTPAASPVKNLEVIRIGDLELGAESHEVRVRGRLIELTPYEFKLLLCLMRNAGKVMTREKLIEQIQGSGVSVVDRAIDTHVFGLRKKLGSAADLIDTVRGVGYRVSPAEPRNK